MPEVIQMIVLVCYASARGSTEGIARRLAARLRDQRIVAEARPIDRITGLTGYDAVVVGSAIHDQAWLPDASRFVRDHAAVLSARPVWLFSVGMPGALPRVLQRWAMREGDKVIAGLEAEFRPRGQRLFSGVIRPDHLPPISRVILRLMGGRYGDFRDWPAVDAWADEIAEELTGARAPGAGAPRAGTG